MKGLLRIALVAGVVLVGGIVLAMDADSKEAKTAARIAKEKAARERFEATARANLLARQKRGEQRDRERLGEAAVASQSSSTVQSSTAPAVETEKTSIPTPFTGQPIRGLDDEEAPVETKEEKAVVPADVRVPKKVEERLTVTIKADDAADNKPASETKVALAWLLQLQPIAATFDEQHKNEAKAYKGDKSVCDYGQGDDKVARVPGCPICDTVAQAWFEGLHNKKQLAIMVYALRTAYEKQNSETPRDIAKRLFDRLAVRAHTENPYTEEDLKNLWRMAYKLDFPSFATGLVNQLRQVVGELPAETVAQEDFIQEHKLAKPLLEQMKFETLYAEGKAPSLSLNMLQAYSFLPKRVGATVDAMCEAIKNHSWLATLMEQLPSGKAKTDLGIKIAEQKVEEKGFDQAALDAIPEGYFKYLIRKIYFQKNRQPIDGFPIARVMEILASRKDVNFYNLGLTDVAWLNDELYLLNEAAPIRFIYIGNNELVTLPTNFLQSCTELRALGLDENKLALLPTNFLQNCTQLNELRLGYNKLAALPANFLQSCINLAELRLYNNELAVLPTNFLQNCTQLRRLDFSHNKLVALPKDFLQNCTKLELLGLSDNKLAALPKDFLQNCTQLKDFHLEKNKLVGLPVSFLQNCTELEELWLNDNKLAALPANFLQNCTKLKFLHLDDNKLAALPKDFLKNCTQLRTLSIVGNPWTSKRPSALVDELRARGVDVIID